MKRFILFLAALPFSGNAQFAPAAGSPGTTAIKKDSSIIINWATGCKIIRGLQDISNPGLGFADAGDSSKATGVADITGIVSLGDGGSATLNFQSPIKNLPGPDFCVFENSFDPGFLELAFVEVSSDGINFSRFPATCNVQNTVQIGPFDTNSEPSKINNLAGKYIGGYGVPFDLQELAGTAGLDVNAVTHVKIIDVVGCIQPQYARYDKNNNIINNIWATAFGSCGFDLDAVGVIHQVPVSVEEQKELHDGLKIFSSITEYEIVIMNSSGRNYELTVCDFAGKYLLHKEVTPGKNRVPLNNEKPGIYFFTFKNEKSVFTKKVITGF